MKKFLLTFCLLFTTNFCFSQSLVVAGDSIIYGNASDFQLESHLQVINVSNDSVWVYCEKNVILQNSPGTNNFCWGGNCFGENTIVSTKLDFHMQEIKDTYLRLDKDLGKMLKLIDNQVGFENVIVFITADHGVVSEPKELLERNIPGGYFDGSIMKTEISTHLNDIYGKGDWVKNYSNNQLFLNHDLILEKKINLEEIQRNCADFFLKGLAKKYILVW